jgi:putative transposase
MSNESRLLYNHFLHDQNEYYRENKKHLSYFIQQKQLKDYKTEYLTYDLKKEVLLLLEANYRSFFALIKQHKELNPKPPKFRSYKYWFTLSITQDFMIKDNSIVVSLPNRKRLILKLQYTKPIDDLICGRHKGNSSDIKQLKIYKRNDEYYFSVSYDKKEPIDKNNINKTVSIDMGKLNLVTSYNYENNESVVYNSNLLSRNQKYFDKRIDELKSKRDKKIRNSIKNKKINSKAKTLQSKKNTQQKLILHKLSKDLSKNNIVIGDLKNLKANTKTKYSKINRQMQNNWNLSTFMNQLEYKTKLRGNKYIKVNEAWTSKTCSKCGRIIDNLTLSNRQYKCDCGLDIDRDVNGAINIYKTYLGDYNTPIDFDNLSISKRFS